jgi:hypothetical protein
MLRASTVSDVVDCGGFVDARVVVGYFKTLPDGREIREAWGPSARYVSEELKVLDAM